MRLAFVVLGLVIVSMAPLRSQTPRFKSSVNLVSIDVTVLDKSGRPVPGLTADDFRIKLNGQAQSVQTLTFVNTEPAPAGAEAVELSTPVTGRRVASNTGPQLTQRVLVLAVDDLSFPSEGGLRLLRSARRLLDQQPRDVFVGVITTSGRPVLNPTLDRRAVLAALAQVKGAFKDPRKSSVANAAAVGILEAVEIIEHNNNAVRDTMLHRECGDAGKTNVAASNNVYANPISIYNEMCASVAMTTAKMIAADTRENASRQIAAITAALDALKGARGLKQMLLLSEGIAIARASAAAVAPISRAAANAGVQLSVIMEDTDDVDVSESVHTINDLAATTYTTGVSNRMRDDRLMFRSSLQTLADASGGSFDLAVGNADVSFDRAMTAGSAVYRLGVEMPANVPKSKLLDVVASVTRADLVVRVNRQVLAETSAASQTSVDEVTGAMMAGELHYRVPVRVAVVRRRAVEAANVELGVGLEVPSAVKGPLTVTVGLIDQKGLLKKGTRRMPVPADAGDYTLNLPLIVAPGLYGLRVAVSDADGNVGSIETNVEARLAPVNDTTVAALTTSDVLTWITDSKGNAQLLAMDNVPSGCQSLGAGLELYTAPGASLPAGLTVAMSVSSASNAGPLLNRAATLYPGRDMTRAEVDLPIASLPSGAYILKATVSVGGKVVGEASAVFRKS